MKLPDFLKVFKQKSFIGSLIFAVALWLYTSLNSEYKTFITVPLTIKMPDNRAIEDEIPKNIQVEIQGSGWNIFNINVFNNSKKVVVDLTAKALNDSTLLIGRSEFLKGMQSLESVVISQIDPEIMQLKTGRVVTAKVPVKPNIRIFPREDFLMVGTVSMLPDSINITGNEKLISKIKKWETVFAFFEDANLPFKSEVKLSDSLDGIINLSRNSIDIYADIQQVAEIELPDTEIIVRGGSKPKDSYFYPPQVTVTLQGGIRELEKITSDKIAVSIDLQQILNDSTGVIIPKVEYPSGLKLLKFDPPVIYHYKQNKVKNLAGVK